ncbi:MAG: hypothetical protein J6S69_04005 [Proteobacteria bacterium]|nr:hypothetical protein [Pseudomonadota bacterium]
MDFKNNDNGLFGARNENSVLFSLEDLNSIDNSNSDNAGSGFGSSGDASGLINLDMLSKMGSSAGAGSDDEDGSIGGVAMESMVFNKVVEKRTTRNYALIIGICVLLLAVAGGCAFFFISSSKTEKLEAEKALAAAEASEEAERAANEREVAELKAQLEAMKKQNLDSAEDKARLEAMIQKLEDAEMQAKVAGGGDEEKKTTAAKKPSGTTAKASAGSAPKAASSGGGAGKPDPEKIRAALGDAANKAKKCGKNGTLLVQMNINSSGSAKGVKGVSGTFKGTATEKCIITVVEKHQFPAFSGNAIPVKYNFKL